MSGKGWIAVPQNKFRGEKSEAPGPINFISLSINARIRSFARSGDKLKFIGLLLRSTLGVSARDVRAEAQLVLRGGDKGADHPWVV